MLISMYVGERDGGSMPGGISHADDAGAVAQLPQQATARVAERLVSNRCLTTPFAVYR